MTPEYNKDVRTIFLTIGLPGSGKSFQAKQMLIDEPNRWRRINRDDLLMMLWQGPWNGRNEDERVVTEVVETALRSAVSAGFDIILDNTFLNSKDRKAIHLIAEDIGDCVVVEKVFEVPLEECLRRNALREGAARVPDEVIIAKAKQFHVGKDGKFKGLSDKVVPYVAVSREPLVQNQDLPPAVIVDLDGTLCLIREGNRYDASRCEEDVRNDAVMHVLMRFYDSCEIIFMSGRSDKYRSETERWLQKNVRQEGLYKYSLHMRAEGDVRKDCIVKQELFEKHVKGQFNVLFCLDDRGQVVRLWRSLGLNCFQVADGNF